MERQLRTYIKTIRSDRGGEYFFSEFRAYLSEHGNLSHLVTPGTSQQNGVAKRRNIILFKMVRFIMSYSNLPILFWGHALETTMYLLNVVPSNSVPKTPLEMWNGCKPSLRHIHIWGCLADVLKGKADKLESRFEVCLVKGLR